MKTRRLFGFASGFILAQCLGMMPGLDPSAFAEAENPPPSFTVVSYNVMYFHGFPPERAALRGTPGLETEEAIVRRVRKQIPLRIALELELYDPDIISLQEARGEENVGAIANYLGMNHAFFPPSAGALFPGAILTRFPIVEAQTRPVAEGDSPPDLFTRHWGRVLLQTGFGKLAVHSAHLYPFGNRGAETRAREITEMLRMIGKDFEAGHFVLLLGDLNHTPSGPEYGRWLKAGLVDTWAKKNDGVAFTIPSTGPRPGGEDRRIDYIFSDARLATLLLHARILHEGGFQTRADATTSFALSDHLPVLSIFKKP